MTTDESRELQAAEKPTLEEMHRQFEEFLEDSRFEEARELLETLHPAEIAEIIGGMSGLHRNLLFDLVDVDSRADVVAYLEEWDQESQLDRMTDAEIRALVDDLPSDDAADMLGLLSDEDRERILATSTPEERRQLERLLGYDEESAGGLMAVELAVVRDNQTVRDAVEAVRRAKDLEVEDIHYVYVIDAKRRLIGRAPILEVMLASRSQPISDVFEEDMVSVSTEMDQEDVARLFARYDLISAPVVDEEGRLVGRITVDDIMDVISEEAEEDIGLLSGTGEEEVGEPSILRAGRARLPWLLVAFFGELLASVVLAGYEESLQRLIIISFFIPVVIAVAGNVGVQSSSIVIRGLATGEIPMHHTFRRLMRELAVGILNGIVISALFALVVYLWKGDLMVATAVSLSLICVIVIAAFTGSSTPMILKRLNVDPANASG
ncbi:magnesium transporter, partial [bacterium]|nr:magnesium transporter [bacterium]